MTTPRSSIASRRPVDGGLAQILADAEAAGWVEWIRSEADERALLEGCTFDIWPPSASATSSASSCGTPRGSGPSNRSTARLAMAIGRRAAFWLEARGRDPPFPPRLH